MRRASLALVVLGAELAGCVPRPGREHAGAYFLRLPLGARATLPVPADNHITRAKVELGRTLFFDTRLSRDGSLACASCHQPARAFTDGRPVAVGVGGRVGRRNVPALFNRAYGRSMFWDGRVRTLEEQALLPMTGPNELGNTHEEIVRRLSASDAYRQRFARAFGTTEVSIERVAAAIASFERTLVTGDSPFDRYRELGDSAAVSAEARRGLEIFQGRARCVLCHDGQLFTDERFHNSGVAFRDGALADSGRYIVTGRPEDLGAFKTPTLRELTRTVPYMHDGSIATLEEVVDFYDRGGIANPYRDPLLHPLGLTDGEKRALLALLRSLSAAGR
jgi:cytochrome c peroxidase